MLCVAQEEEERQRVQRFASPRPRAALRRESCQEVGRRRQTVRPSVVVRPTGDAATETDRGPTDRDRRIIL